MIKTFKTEAIVLRKRSLPNQDLVIYLLSKEKGKLVVFAKGIKKITSRRLPHTQVGNLIKAVIHFQESRFYLQESELISSFSKIKENERKLPYLFFSMFVADRLLPEHQKEERIYDHMLRFLIGLSKEEYNISHMLKWTNKTMQLLGYIHTDKEYEDLRNFIENIIEEKLPFV